MPVTNGLICWLDGRDGNDFELRGFTFSGDDGWTGNNLKVNFEQVAIKENFSLPEEYTIEVDMFVDGVKGFQSTFFYFGDGSTSGDWRECVVRDDSGTFQVLQHNYKYNRKLFLKRYNLSIMGNRNSLCLYIDGIREYRVSVDNNVLSDLIANFYLGCGCNFDRYCKARFNSVRVYNRILTEEEIKHNYEYEQLIQR